MDGGDLRVYKGLVNIDRILAVRLALGLVDLGKTI